MQTTDRMRILRGLGLAMGALLLVSGAVFASQAGVTSSDDHLGTESSASAEASEMEHASPSASATDMTVDDLVNQFGDSASAEPSESEQEHAGSSAEASESPEASESDQEHAGSSAEASESPEPSESPEASESEQEHAGSSAEASASPDDQGGTDDGHHDH